jgi:hypothetical protein
MTQKFDIDPQETIIRALDLLQAGWIKGTLKGKSGWNGGITINPHDGQDPSGVCLRGAFQESLKVVFNEQLRARVPQIPGVSEGEYNNFIQCYATSFALKIEAVFEKAMVARLPMGYTSVEGWNDQRFRTKEEVVSFLKSLLDDVMAEVHSRETEAATTLEAIDRGVHQGADLNTIDGMVDREQELLQTVRALFASEYFS